MKTFPAGFALEMAKNTGARPVWILKITVGGVDYYLSDLAFAIASWQGGVTTLPWIAQWGQVREGLAGELGEIRIGDLSIDGLVDVDATPNLADLAVADDFEASPVILYLWFRDLDPATDPPQEMARFFVRDPVELPDETTVRFGLEDQASRLQQILGNKLTAAEFPAADPDDIGKIIPLVFGNVRRLPTLAADAGAQTTLPSAINASVTSFDVTDATGFAIGMTFIVDDEEMTITDITGDTFTVTRGVNATVAALHGKGAVAWQYKDEYVYLVADGEVAAIPKVYGRVGENEVEISAIASRYLGAGTVAVVAAGQVGGQHPDYLGRACLTIPSYITVSQSIDLLVNDGIDVNDAIAVVDSIAVNDSISVYDTIALSNGTHGHTADLLGSKHQYQTGGSWSDLITSINVSQLFPSAGGTIVDSDYSFNWQASCTSGTIDVYIDGVLKQSGVVSASGAYVSSYTGTNAPVLSVTGTGAPYTTLQVSAGERNVALSGSVNNETVAKTGTAAKTGAASKSGAASKTGSATKTGTVTVVGNSAANTLVGDVVLVDVTGLLSDPADVVGEILDTWCGIATLSTSGTLPASYRIDGAIVDARRAIDWLDQIAFQCRSYFRMRGGEGLLIHRPDTLTAQKVIPNLRISSGRMALSRRKASMTEVLNKIDLLYDRDWSNADTQNGYRAILQDTNAQSVTDYGTLERPELFRFDFVRDTDMAADLLAFYLAQYGRRYWLHEFEVFLHQSDLEFGDAVSLAFLGAIDAEVQSAGYYPGDINRLDTITLTCRSLQPGDPRYVRSLVAAAIEAGATIDELVLSCTGGTLAVQDVTAASAIDEVSIHEQALFADDLTSASAIDGIAMLPTPYGVGRNIFGQIDIDSFAGAVDVSAGRDHSVAAMPDGSAVAVGDNTFGQCNVGSITDAVKVSAGYDHTVALKSDGTVAAVGDNTYGQCNVGSWTGIVQVVANRYATIGVKSNGTVVATGLNDNGQLSVSSWTDIEEVAAGGNHTIGRKSDGTVVAVGYNGQGQTGVSGWSTIVAIAANLFNSYGVKSDGTVVYAGDNTFGQGNVSGWTNIDTVAAGELYTVGVEADGTVVGAGDNTYGQLDITNWAGVTKASAQYRHTLGLWS